MDPDQPPARPPRHTRTGGWVGRLRQRLDRPGPEGGPGRGSAPVGIVTDSAAALPEPWVAGHGRYLRVVPMPVMIDHQIYAEGTDDVPHELALGLAMGKSVRTSRPAPGQLLRAYRELADAGVRHIVSIHLSGALSGTVEAARLAAAQSPVPVTVVDSLTVALAEGFAVMAAVDAAAAGAGAEELAQLAGRAAENHVFFAVPSLEQLRRGGRIGTVASMLGTLLNVKPILGVSDGHIVAHEKVRTQSRTVARLVAIARREAEARGPEARLAVHYFGNEAAAEELVHELAGASRFEVLAVPVPAVLGAHTGAGVLAVAIGGGSAPRPPGPAEGKARPAPGRRDQRPRAGAESGNVQRREPPASSAE